MGSPAPQNYQLQAQPQQDTAVQGNIAAEAAMPNYGQEVWNQTSPALLALSGPTGYNPQAPVQAGQAVINNASGLPGYEQRVFNDGFDPQKALYDRTAQQTQDQTRAALEARGVDSTPYGAGVEGQTMSDFNINWQNNQLNRESTAVSAGTTLADEYNKSNSTGVGLEAMAPNLQGAAVSSLESAAQGAYAKPQQDINNNLAYLNQGNANGATAIKGQEVNNQGLGSLGSTLGSLVGISAK